MVGLCRKLVGRVSGSGLCSNSFVAGVLVAVLFNLLQVQYKDVIEDVIEDKVAENSLFDRLETNMNIVKDVEQETYVRPIFIRDEINISERIFVGVLLDETGSRHFPKYFNLTTRHYIDKFVVFTDSNSSFRNESGAVVLHPNTLDAAIQYVKEKHSDYLYYYLAPSTVLVNGMELAELVTQLQFEEDVLMGTKSAGSSSCDFTKGILLSNSLVRSSSTNSKHIPIGCESSLLKHRYVPVEYQSKDGTEDVATAIYGLRSDHAYHEATISILRDQLKRGQEQLDEVNEELEVFVDESDFIEQEWPEVVYKPAVELERFDDEVWDSENVDIAPDPSQLSAPQTQTWNSFTKQCFSEQQTRLTGWRKVDADLGAQYLLHAELEGEDSKVFSADCQVFQEFSDPLTVSLPFVTESTKISLIIPVSETDTKEILTFIKNFAKTCLERNDRVFLMLVFLYSKDRPDKNNNKDFYKQIKQSALQLSKKFKKKDKGSSILWYSMQLQNSTPTLLETMDLVTQKLDSKSIILLGSPTMELHSDYLNRVRMNTIEGRLSFSPIPFTEFHPQITEMEGIPGDSVRLNSSTGRFDDLDYQHFSFYKSDYLSLRENIELPLVLKEDQLLSQDQQRELPVEAFRFSSLFTKFGHVRNKIEDTLPNFEASTRGSLHVIRAPEPSLRLRYRSVNCPQNVPKLIYSDCIRRRQMSLGNRAQLANIFLNNHNL